MTDEERAQIAAVLGPITRAEWQEFFETDVGAGLERKLDAVRDALKAADQIAIGPRRKPHEDLIDLLGYRLLVDDNGGRWLRESLLRRVGARAWSRLFAAY